MNMNQFQQESIQRIRWACCTLDKCNPLNIDIFAVFGSTKSPTYPDNNGPRLFFSVQLPSLLNVSCDWMTPALLKRM